MGLPKEFKSWEDYDAYFKGMTFEEKRTKGYLFRYRWQVGEGKFQVVASGDTKEEALQDANRSLLSGAGRLLGIAPFTNETPIRMIGGN